MNAILVLLLAVPVALVMAVAFRAAMAFFSGPGVRPHRQRRWTAVPFAIVTYLAACGFVASWLGFTGSRLEEYGVSDSVTQSYITVAKKREEFTVSVNPDSYTMNVFTGSISYANLSIPGEGKTIKPADPQYSNNVEVMQEMFDAAARASRTGPDGPAIARIRQLFTEHKQRFITRK